MLELLSALPEEVVSLETPLEFTVAFCKLVVLLVLPAWLLLLSRTLTLLPLFSFLEPPTEVPATVILLIVPSVKASVVKLLAVKVPTPLVSTTSIFLT